MYKMNSKKVVRSCLISIGILVAIILLIHCMVKIPAGYVGVQYDLNGGIKPKVLTQGFHLVSPTVDVTKYTVGIEQSYLTAEDKGDSKNDESFTASSVEGKSVTLDLTYTYQYKSENVTDVFVKFKGQSGTEIRDSFIKPNIVSWTKEVISNYSVSDIIGSKRAEINTALTKYLSEKFAAYNINISNASMVNVDVDKKTMEVINNKIAAQQNAETQAINNKTAVEKAKADAEVQKTNAQAKADAQLIEAKAEAEANAKLSKSITDPLIRMKEAEARLKHGWITVSGNNTAVVKEDSSK